MEGTWLTCVLYCQSTGPSWRRGTRAGTWATGGAHPPASTSNTLGSPESKDPPVACLGQPPGHHRARAARPHHHVLPGGGGEVLPHQVLQVGRGPGGGGGQVDDEGRQQHREEHEQQGSEEHQHQTTTNHPEIDGYQQLLSF